MLPVTLKIHYVAARVNPERPRSVVIERLDNVQITEVVYEYLRCHPSFR